VVVVETEGGAVEALIIDSQFVGGFGGGGIHSDEVDCRLDSNKARFALNTGDGGQTDGIIGEDWGHDGAIILGGNIDTSGSLNFISSHIPSVHLQNLIRTSINTSQIIFRNEKSIFAFQTFWNLSQSPNIINGKMFTIVDISSREISGSFSRRNTVREIISSFNKN